MVGHDLVLCWLYPTTTGNLVVLLLTYKDIQELESDLLPLYLSDTLSFQLHSSPIAFKAEEN